MLINDKKLDVAALGTCYVDINCSDYPLTQPLKIEQELVGYDYEVVPGGSAVITCRRLSGLGLQTAFVGQTGKDEFGSLFLSKLKDAGVVPYVAQNPNLTTNISFNLTSSDDQHLIMITGTANVAIDYFGIKTQVDEVSKVSEVFYIGGCIKLKALADDFANLADLVHQNGCKIAIDHGRIPTDTTKEMLEKVKLLVSKADYYFTSRQEFCGLWGVDDIDQAAEIVQKNNPNIVLLIKDGSNGAFYYNSNESGHVPATKLEKTVNLTGAGDTFNAGVLSSLLGGKSLKDSVGYGCQVAAEHIRGKI